MNAVLPFCAALSAAFLSVVASTPAAAQTDTNGIKVGDNVEVVTGFGWTPAKVLAIHGNTYSVLTNGARVSKDYPGELRRIGAATNQDHANGQYKVGDSVQVNFEGHWTDTKIITTMGMEYQVAVPGNRTLWASPQDLRPAAAPATSTPNTGGPPKPGMTSCAGKIEGRYATAGSPLAFTITFRSGKAVLTDSGGNFENFECWTGGEGIYLLHKPDASNLDMSIDINNDGTLQTPLGEIKKKGN